VVPRWEPPFVLTNGGFVMSGDPGASALVEGQILLRKPFTKRQLVDSVRDALTAAHAA